MKAILTLTLMFSFILSVHSQESNPNVKKWTLRECVDYAIENNINVKQSENDIAMAEISKRDAVGNFIPSLNLNSAGSWNAGLTTDASTGVLVNQTTQTTNGGLSSGVAIYRGLRNQNELRRAELSILASQYQLDKMKDDISLYVINAYLEVLFGKEAVNVAIPQIEITREQLIRTSQLVEAGTIPRGDLLDVEATLASDEQNLIITQNRVQLALISLAQLLQLDDFENFDVVPEEFETLPLLNLAEYSVDKIFEKALATRNEIKVAEANIDIAEKDIKLAKGALQPTLSGFYNWNSRYSDRDQIVGRELDPDNPFVVIGQVQTTGDNVIADNYSPIVGAADGFFDQIDKNKGSSFGLSLSIPVLNGFRASNNVRRAEINFEQQKYQLEQEELDLAKDHLSSVYRRYRRIEII